VLRIALSILAAGLSMSACAALSGVGDYSVIDGAELPPPCTGGGCVDAGAINPGPRPPDEVVDAYVPPPNECDPTRDGNCIEVPTGFSLIALATFADQPPECPSGFATPKTVGTQPTAALPAACGCTTCTVTEQAECLRIIGKYGPNENCAMDAAASFYASDPPNCKNTNYMQPYLNFSRYRFDAPTGGACTPNAPTKNPDAVVWSGVKNRMCTSTAVDACKGGRCKVNVIAPYQACLAARAGAACPAAFPLAANLGSPDFDCAGGVGACSCTVNRAACAGKMFLYRDAACTQNETEVTVNDTCMTHPGVPGNMWPSFKSTATSQTTCTSAGNGAATNLRLVDTQTICCR